MINVADAVLLHSRVDRSVARQAILQGLPTPDFRDAAADFLNRWHARSSSVGAEAVAVALVTAARSEQDHQREETVEIVWTGPEPAETQFRQTEQAILQLLDTAKDRITLISYAVYSIPNVSVSLVNAARRGVKLTVILETPDKLDGQSDYNTLRALGADVEVRSSVYYWPQQFREVGKNGKPGSLHVKCVVADGHSLFLSSANLTEQAFTINMELGLLISGGSIPSRIEQQFQRLINDGQLKQI